MLKEVHTVDKRLTDIKDSLYRVSIKAVIIYKNKILLVKETDTQCWGIPGGGIDYGESSRQALAREVHEELGLEEYQIKIADEPFLAETTSYLNGIPRFNVYYKVTIVSGDIQKTNDVDEQKWFDVNELSTIALSPSVATQIGIFTKLLSS